MLDQVYAQSIGGTGKAPGHGIMAGHAATPLYGGADDRVAGVLRAIEVGNLVRYLFAVEQFTVHTIEAVGADPTLGVTHVLQGVAQVIDAALGEHHVVVQVLGQTFP